MKLQFSSQRRTGGTGVFDKGEFLVYWSVNGLSVDAESTTEEWNRFFRSMRLKRKKAVA